MRAGQRVREPAHERRRRPSEHRPRRPPGRRDPSADHRVVAVAWTGRPRGAPYTPAVGDWYEIGITLGLGVAAGLLLAGLVAAWRYGVLVSTLGALAIGAVAGLLVKGWIGLPGALVGAVIGAVSASIVARGALRRGATPGGTAFLVGSASIFIAMLALIPRRRVRDRRGRARRSPRAARGRSPSATQGSARSPGDAAEARPRRDRRPHADDAGGVARHRDDTDADGARGARARSAARRRPSRRSRPSASRRSRPARTPTSTRSRTSSGGTAASDGSSSTARRSAPRAPPGSAARCATRSSG